MGIELFVFLIASLATVLTVSLKPKLFWPALVIVNIFGNGPRLMGYYLWDEALTIAILFGALMYLSVAHYPKERRPLSQHGLVFIIWIIYMITESVIGIAANNDPRIIRWVIFYTILVLLFFFIYYKRKVFTFPDFKQMALVVTITTLIYYAIYILQGNYYDRLLGDHGRFAAQFLRGPFAWAGSATAVIPTLIAMPAALFLIKDKSFSIRLLSWFSIFMMMGVGFYYDSRISWIIIFSCFIIYAFRMKLINIVVFVFILSLFFLVFVKNPAKNVSLFFKDLNESAQSLWISNSQQRSGNLTRKLQFEAGIKRLVDNPRTFLIGDGIYSHRFTIYPYIHSLDEAYLPKPKFFNKSHYEEYKQNEEHQIYRTTAFTGLLIDTGLIGMLLFIFNFVFMGIKLIVTRSANRNVFLITLLISFMWLFVNNISDVILVYLLIMPCGLIEQWNQASMAGIRNGMKNNA